MYKYVVFLVIVAQIILLWTKTHLLYKQSTSPKPVFPSFQMCRFHFPEFTALVMGINIYRSGSWPGWKTLIYTYIHGQGRQSTNLLISYESEPRKTGGLFTRIH